MHVKRPEYVECDPKEIALKSFFLGPQAENAEWTLALLVQCFERWTAWRKSLFPNDGCAITASDQLSGEFVQRRENIEKTIFELFERFSTEVPKFSPRYLGHMFSEVSIPALLGHIVTLLYNPNNISGESSRVGIVLEAEAIQFLVKMVGYAESAQGHFTSGGTIANFEALIRARSRNALWLSASASLHQGKQKLDFFRDAHPGWENYSQLAVTADREKWDYSVDPWGAAKKLEALYGCPFSGGIVLIPENKHYSWKKGCQLLGFGTDAFWPVALDHHGHLSVPQLQKQIARAAVENKPIAMIVSVVGTTEMASIDPVHEVQAVIDEWKDAEDLHFWHHVDAAYGGFLCTMDRVNSNVLSDCSVAALNHMKNANSITLDPHKLGYVPYASGAVLVRDPHDYFYHGLSEAPYLDFNLQKDKGPFTIEGSRSAAGAVATWVTAKTIGLNANGYGLLLERTFRIADELIEKLQNSGLSVQIGPGLDSNLVCFSCARTGEALSAANERTLQVYQAFSPKQNGAFIVSKTALSWDSYGLYLEEWAKECRIERDGDEVYFIRMTIMNPFLGAQQMDVNYLEQFIEELRNII